MTGASIILVEDEALIRMMLADMIEELGHRVVAEAGNIQVGQALAQAAIFDLAVLDINIAGYSIRPVAEIIDGRGLAVFLCHRLWASRPTRSVQNTPGASASRSWGTKEKAPRKRGAMSIFHPRRGFFTLISAVHR